MGLYKSRTISLARETADLWFGRYIRIRDTNEDGTIDCITCGTTLDPEEDTANASHWIEKSKIQTRWNEWNANASCVTCNLHHDNGLAAWHGKEIAAKFGKEIPDELIKISKSDLTFDKEETMKIARKYKQMAEELAEQKGIDI